MAATSHIMQLLSYDFQGPNAYGVGEFEQSQLYETLNFSILPGNQLVFHITCNVDTLLGTFARVRLYLMTGSFQTITDPETLLLHTFPDFTTTGSFHIESSPISKPTGSFAGPVRLTTSVETDGGAGIVGPAFQLELVP